MAFFLSLCRLRLVLGALGVLFVGNASCSEKTSEAIIIGLWTPKGHHAKVQTLLVLCRAPKDVALRSAPVTVCVTLNNLAREKATLTQRVTAGRNVVKLVTFKFDTEIDLGERICVNGTVYDYPAAEETAHIRAIQGLK